MGQVRCRAVVGASGGLDLSTASLLVIGGGVAIVGGARASRETSGADGMLMILPPVMFMTVMMAAPQRPLYDYAIQSIMGFTVTMGVSYGVFLAFVAGVLALIGAAKGSS